MYVHISNKVSGLIRFIFDLTLIFHDTATIRLQVLYFWRGVSQMGEYANNAT